MNRLYTAINGQQIEAPEPTGALVEFVERVFALANDKKKTANDMIALVYSRENPILDQTIFPTRGAVTKEVLDNPWYHIFADLIFRKECAEDGTTAEELAEQYTLTVPEAAEQLKIHPASVQKAIAAKRLPVWVKGNKHYLDPKTFHLLGAVGQRGPSSPDVQPLTYRVGKDKEHMLRIKSAEGEPDSKKAPVEGSIERWRRVAVLHGHGDNLRLFVLEPSAESNEIERGDFFVRGNFEIKEKTNNRKSAEAKWEAFLAQ
jgi:hypothetical protein